MSILLGFNDYGTLNMLDDNVLNYIKSFLYPTPREEFIEIHQHMIKRKFRPYNKKIYYGRGLMALVAHGVQDIYITRSDTPTYYIIKLRDGSERIYKL